MFLRGLKASHERILGFLESSVVHVTINQNLRLLILPGEAAVWQKCAQNEIRIAPLLLLLKKLSGGGSRNMFAGGNHRGLHEADIHQHGTDQLGQVEKIREADLDK